MQQEQYGVSKELRQRDAQELDLLIRPLKENGSRIF